MGIERAPEPDEIYWENTGITTKGSICRKLSLGMVSILMLFIGGMAQYGLAVLTTKATTDIEKYAFRIVNPIIVIVWNSVILSVIVTLTERERN